MNEKHKNWLAWKSRIYGLVILLLLFEIKNLSDFFGGCAMAVWNSEGGFNYFCMSIFQQAINK
jgi:hypothetical protein